MSTTDIVDSARRSLGSVSACLPVSFTTTPAADLQRDAVRRLEDAGYQAVWTNEVIGKDAMVQIAVLLAATERMAFGTCIANIWVRQPQTLHAAAAQLAQAFPGRFVLGVGVGYPQQAAAVGREFGSRPDTMRHYLEKMNEPTWPPAPDVTYPRIIAANGPKMLALSGEIADGALPFVQSAESTAQARQTLGPDKLLFVAIAVEANPDVSVVMDNVNQQLAAGADHVALLLPIEIDFRAGVDQLEQLAPARVAYAKPSYSALP
jgi:probable F420-dependent oxidoreductase